MKRKRHAPLLCGTEPGEVSRIEKVHAAASRTSPSKKQPLLALANHYPQRDHRHLNGATEWEDDGVPEWMSDTHERMESVYAMAADACGCGKLPALGQFHQGPACNNGTVHLALMRPATEELRLKNFCQGKKREH
jgi:hypothetical protein